MARRAGQWGFCVLFCLLLGSCEQHIPVGKLAQKADDGLGGAGGDLESLPNQLVFEAGFETGDLSEWGLSGQRLTSDAGVLTVEQAARHGGNQGALVSTEETGAHLVLNVEGSWEETLIGFWIQVEQVYDTQNWPILHIDAVGASSLEQLWDVGLDGSSGDGYQIFLWEMPEVGAPESQLAALSDEKFPAGQWTHIQVHLRAAPDATGFIRVHLDGQRVLDLSDRRAGNGNPLHLGFGSFAYYLEPRPANYFLDEVSIHVPDANNSL